MRSAFVCGGCSCAFYSSDDAPRCPDCRYQGPSIQTFKDFVREVQDERSRALDIQTAAVGREVDIAAIDAEEFRRVLFGEEP
ncbi:MAG TPA: hypothetical protein VFY29_11885 [Terriglobia bacterium]|nr:hypothetical protein [Terriglobia bacterium]